MIEVQGFKSSERRTEAFTIPAATDALNAGMHVLLFQSLAPLGLGSLPLRLASS